MRDYIHYILLPTAKRDLHGIWVFTYHRWGLFQADRYVERLYGRLSALADRPEQGRQYEDSEEPCLRYHEGRHVIFYRVRGEAIEVARILHDSMDFARHV